MKNQKERNKLFHILESGWHSSSLWLVISAGSLFAGFPSLYGQLLSSHYLLCLFFLFALILRISFFPLRQLFQNKAFDNFSLCMNVLLAFGIGYGTLTVLLKWTLSSYSLIAGILFLTLFLLHGLMYLFNATEGSLHQELRRKGLLVYFSCYPLWCLLLFLLGLHFFDMVRILLHSPLFWILSIIAVLSFSGIGIALILSKRKLGQLCASILLLLPNTMALSHQYSNTSNEASSYSLQILLLLALLGTPILFALLKESFRLREK